MNAFKVAVDAPIPQILSYLPPEDGEVFFDLKRGSKVKVPLGRGNRKVDGIILGEEPQAEGVKYKCIAEIDPEIPELPETYIKWAEWVASYYHYPIGQVFSNFSPPLKKGGRKTKKKSPIPEVEQVEPHPLNEIQQKIINDIADCDGFAAHLLFGVTGSGKTEVYLEEFQKTIEAGKQALFLLPEISLTPQLLRRFSERFGDKLAVIHSQLTDRERTNQWWSMIDGQKQILIGARSALFCPIPNLGLIVVDEEHESSYKQEEKLKYNARDAAVYLAKLNNIPIILGSATPSLETWQNAVAGRYKLHKMTKRISERPLPEVKIIDLREEQIAKKDNPDDLPFWMSKDLHFELNERLERREQSALFLNRRGISQSVICDNCGESRECPNCAIGLSLHAKSHLLCHYCDYHEQLREVCKSCGEGEMIPLGLGTEKMEEDLKKLFPKARLARADRDEITNREDMELLIENIENHEVDILIGTQMIAKGLDFPNLSLVSLVLADIGFNIPDFRSAERSFQLITQVSGRAGRHEIPGLVLLQTYNPDHSSVQFAKTADFEGFAAEELELRKELNYPPFGKIASIRLQGLDLYKVENAAKELAARAEYLQENFKDYGKVQVLGPSPAPLFKLRSKFRYHILIKAPSANLIQHFCNNLLKKQDWLPSGVQLLTDIDPIQLM
ncbi:MAG: primosomal protein N' [Bdellovibrionaceae bacterium]|nr:primosomal protein N' [Pseudobdellovibrionaceae bacterium]|tara:strand:- start:28473 stop:30491 length:2019 start_codon:yes stop_codon:yes gene_type:complete